MGGGGGGGTRLKFNLKSKEMSLANSNRRYNNARVRSGAHLVQRELELGLQGVLSSGSRKVAALKNGLATSQTCFVTWFNGSSRIGNGSSELYSYSPFG